MNGPRKVAETHAMKGRFQFTLRQLFIVTAAVAVCLGVGKWYYIVFVDRVYPVRDGVDLLSYRGKRVALCGRYQYLGRNSPFQAAWVGKKPIPIAIATICLDGSPLPPLADGAVIRVMGRVTDAPKNAVVPKLDTSPDCYDEWELRGHDNTRVFAMCLFGFKAEEVRLISTKQLKSSEPDIEVIKWCGQLAH